MSPCPLSGGAARPAVKRQAPASPYFGYIHVKIIYYKPSSYFMVNHGFQRFRGRHDTSLPLALTIKHLQGLPCTYETDETNRHPAGLFRGFTGRLGGARPQVFTQHEGRLPLFHGYLPRPKSPRA